MKAYLKPFEINTLNQYRFGLPDYNGSPKGVQFSVSFCFFFNEWSDYRMMNNRFIWGQDPLNNREVTFSNIPSHINDKFILAH